MKQLLVFTAALLMSVQVHAEALTPAKIVEQANHQWNAAFNEGNVEKLAELYATDATLSPGNGAVLAGRDAIKELFAGFKSNGVHNHAIESVDVIATDEQITQVAYWQAEGVNADNEAVKFGGVLMLSLKQDESGQWQVQSHVWNMAP